MEGSISQSLIHPIRPLKWPDLNGEFSLASDKTGGSEWLDGWMFGWALPLQRPESKHDRPTGFESWMGVRSDLSIFTVTQSVCPNPSEKCIW